MVDKVKLWFDPEVDYLEVTFSDAPGYMRPTKSDAVMKRVDEQGRVIGFSVFGLSRFRQRHSLEAEFAPETEASIPLSAETGSDSGRTTDAKTESSSGDS